MDGDFINGTTFHLFFFSFLTRERVFHLEAMASFSSHGFSFTKDNYISSSSSDDEIIQEMFANMNSKKQYVSVATIVIANSYDIFNVNELQEDVGQSIDSSGGTKNMFVIMWQCQDCSKF